MNLLNGKGIKFNSFNTVKLSMSQVKVTSQCYEVTYQKAVGVLRIEALVAKPLPVCFNSHQGSFWCHASWKTYVCL